MDKEAALIQALISHNHGATFLLNCGTMSLRMGPGRALLELLVPPSLRVLYIDGDEVPASEMWREFERLSCAAPFLVWLGTRNSSVGELSASSIVYNNSATLFRRLRQL